MSFGSFVTNLDLYVVLRQHNDLYDFNHLFSILKSSCSVQLCESAEKELKNFQFHFRQFCYRINVKWNNCRRIVDKFTKKYSEWLDSEIIWPECIKESMDRCSEETVEVMSSELVSPGKSDASTSMVKTSRKSFEDLSNRQKRRRTEESRANSTENELVYSTECALKSAGRGDVAKVLKYLLENPQEVSKVLKVIGDESITPLEVSPQKALALYITMRLSKWRYIALREFSLKEGHMKYPSYYMLLKEKTECYPKKEDVTVTDVSAKIKLQSLLDLTVRRLVKSLNRSFDAGEQLLLHSKWGFDGASSQSIYHQKTTVSEQDLSTVFMASLVPLKLVKQSSGDIVWQNERPSSTVYCRPISFKFMKETEANVKTELAAFESEIALLAPTDCGNAMITHNLMLTMIDGKVHTYISETSTAVCDLCKARPSEMNQLDVVRLRTVQEDLLKYGLSSLHAWIRSMECLLHIAYKLETKSWQAKGEEMKQKVRERKETIQEAFRRETGLLLDVVRQGSGTTNTGNAARRFFSDPETTARITGIDILLIRRIAVVLQCISSGETIDVKNLVSTVMPLRIYMLNFIHGITCLPAFINC